jgi:hypothetical protein
MAQRFCAAHDPQRMSGTTQYTLVLGRDCREQVALTVMYFHFSIHKR